jgi:hypothetical protein
MGTEAAPIYRGRVRWETCSISTDALTPATSNFSVSSNSLERENWLISQEIARFSNEKEGRKCHMINANAVTERRRSRSGVECRVRNQRPPDYCKCGRQINPNQCCDCRVANKAEKSGYDRCQCGPAPVYERY